MNEQMKNIPSIAVIIILVGIGGYFFYQNQSLEKQIATIGGEKVGVEKELAVLKNSDLAKDLELTRLGLKTSEKDLSDSQKEVSRLGSRVKTLETGLRNIKPYLSAIDAVQLVVLGTTGPTRSVVANVDPKVAALNDSEVSIRWAEAKQNINFEQLSWQQNFFGVTISTIISHILSILPN